MLWVYVHYKSIVTSKVDPGAERVICQLVFFSLKLELQTQCPIQMAKIFSQRTHQKLNCLNNWAATTAYLINFSDNFLFKTFLHIIMGGGPRVVVSTAAFHARVRGSVPGLGGLKETKMFLPHPRVKVSIVGSLRDREVACSASDRQGSNFESCVWRTVSSQSSHHPQEVLLAQFSLYVHKGGLKPDSFHFAYYHGSNMTRVYTGKGDDFRVLQYEVLTLAIENDKLHKETNSRCCIGMLLSIGRKSS